MFYLVAQHLCVKSYKKLIYYYLMVTFPDLLIITLAYDWAVLYSEHRNISSFLFYVKEMWNLCWYGKKKTTQYSRQRKDFFVFIFCFSLKNNYEIILIDMTKINYAHYFELIKKEHFVCLSD